MDYVSVTDSTEPVYSIAFAGFVVAVIITVVLIVQAIVVARGNRESRRTVWVLLGCSVLSIVLAVSTLAVSEGSREASRQEVTDAINERYGIELDVETVFDDLGYPLIAPEEDVFLGPAQRITGSNGEPTDVFLHIEDGTAILVQETPTAYLELLRIQKKTVLR